MTARLEETRALGKCLGNICRSCVFSMRKGVQETRGTNQKVIFLVKCRVFGVLFTIFDKNLPTRQHNEGTLPP